MNDGQIMIGQVGVFRLGEFRWALKRAGLEYSERWPCWPLGRHIFAIKVHGSDDVEAVNTIAATLGA